MWSWSCIICLICWRSVDLPLPESPCIIALDCFPILWALCRVCLIWCTISNWINFGLAWWQLQTRMDRAREEISTNIPYCKKAPAFVSSFPGLKKWPPLTDNLRFGWQMSVASLSKKGWHNLGKSFASSSLPLKLKKSLHLDIVTRSPSFKL